MAKKPKTPSARTMTCWARRTNTLRVCGSRARRRIAACAFGRWTSTKRRRGGFPSSIRRFLKSEPPRVRMKRFRRAIHGSKPESAPPTWTCLAGARPNELLRTRSTRMRRGDFLSATRTRRLLLCRRASRSAPRPRRRRPPRTSLFRRHRKRRRNRRRPCPPPL